MPTYTLIVPTFVQMLRALSAQLDKGAVWAEAQGLSPDALMAKRLAPDMHPLSSQVQFVCIQATETISRLLDRDRREIGPVETFAQARTLIAETLVFLDGVAAADFAGVEERPIVLTLSNGMTFDMVGATFVRDWALAQFYFHLVTAYDILRHCGVDLGKADYVSHMFAYLRAGDGRTAA